jgi:FkbM family methyltransferase
LILDHPERKFINELFNLGKSDGIFIDCGANAGYYAINLAENYPKVLAVEPAPIFYEQLLMNINYYKILNITPIQKAVSNKLGTATLYGNALCPFGRDCPSLNQKIGLSYEGRSKTMPLSLMEVTLTTIEELADNQPVGLVKVDTEGNELEVLLGAKSIMDKIDAWHVEVHDWEFCPAITSLLEREGYIVKERGLDGRQKGWLLATK